MISLLRQHYIKLLLIGAFGIACAVVGAGGYRFVSKRLERNAIYPEAQPMIAGVEFGHKHKCTAVSPPISVKQVPANATHLAVQVTDLNYIFVHGGGTVPVPSSGVIPEGALTSYFGPCPDEGDHTYRFRVNALDEHGLIVGIAEQSLPCCSAY